MQVNYIDFGRCLADFGRFLVDFLLILADFTKILFSNMVSLLNWVCQNRIKKGAKIGQNYFLTIFQDWPSRGTSSVGLMHQSSDPPSSSSL